MLFQSQYLCIHKTLFRIGGGIGNQYFLRYAEIEYQNTTFLKAFSRIRSGKKGYKRCIYKHSINFGLEQECSLNIKCNASS